MKNIESLNLDTIIRLDIPIREIIRIWADKTPAVDRGKGLSDVPAIGEYWPGEGGVNAGLMRNPKGRPYFLIIPDNRSGVIEGTTYGGRGVDEPGAADEYDGLANTRALVESTTEHPAAMWADGLSIDNHSDFYLLARREAALAYANVSEMFPSEWFITSTQYSAGVAWGQHFGYGYQFASDKVSQASAAAGRRLFI